MTKSKKKHQTGAGGTTPSSASKRKSQTLTLDEFLSPTGDNLIKELDSNTHDHHHHHQQEEVQHSMDAPKHALNVVVSPIISDGTDRVQSTDHHDIVLLSGQEEMEQVLNIEEQEPTVVVVGVEHQSDNGEEALIQITINDQDLVLDKSISDQNPNWDETSSLIQEPIEEPRVVNEENITKFEETYNTKENNTTTTMASKLLKEYEQPAAVVATIQPPSSPVVVEQPPPPLLPSLTENSQTSSFSSNATTTTTTATTMEEETPTMSIINNNEETTTTIKSKKEDRSSPPQHVAVVSKRVLEKLSITPEIRKLSTKDLSHVTKMTLITQEPTNSNICCAYVTLERPISHEELRSRLEKRVVQKYSRFRSTVSEDYNTFCDQELIDIEQHIRYIRVPKSGNRDDYSQTEENELVRQLLGKLVCEPFDFSKPLWECVVIDNCPTLGYILLFRIHHAIGDGASLVMFFSQFCDQGEEHFKEELHERKEKLISKAIKSLEHVPLVGFLIRVMAFMWFLLGLLLVVLKWALMIVGGSDKSLFKTPLSTEKQVSWTKPFDIADIKLVSNKICTNSTVNDVVLNSLSGTLLRYTERRSNKDCNMNVTLSVPVNIRLQEEEFNNLSNKFGFMLVPLNLKKLSRNPESRLSQVKKIMDKNKRLPEPYVTYQTCRLVNILPKHTVSSIYKVVTRWVSAVFTNIVGSTTQLTVEGVNVKNLVVFSPSPSTVGLSFAISSHNGKVVMGVCADILTANPQELVKDFENDLDQIISMAKSLNLH